MGANWKSCIVIYKLGLFFMTKYVKFTQEIESYKLQL